MCSEESGCITKTLNCPHARGEHDETCGYVAPSDGAECGFVCDQCNQNAAGENDSQQGEVNQPNPSETAVCTCTERCQEGAGNAQCPVCAADPAACAVQDMQEPQEPTCGSMEGCIDGKHDPACPLYEAPACGNLEGCADGKHDPECILYVAEEPAEQADTGLTGSCGDNATYTLTPNDETASTYTLTISGTGPTYDYDNNAPWVDKKGTITNLVITPGITYLGDTLFNEMTNLKIDIVLPDTVTAIGTNLFRKSGITSLNLNQVTSLPHNAVAYACPNLTSVNLGAVTTISGNNNFRDCTNLSSVQADNLVQDTGTYSFYGKSKLSTVRFPQLKEIGYAMFAVTNIHSFVFEAPLTSVIQQNFIAGHILYVVDSVSAANIHVDPSNANSNPAVLNGGAFAPDATFESGVLATPARAGYKFAGWYDNADFSGEAVSTPENGKTYYAKWEESVALSITLSDGKTLALNLPKASTVADVKQRIQQELWLAPAQMVLTLNDQTLEDGKDLTACGIENGSTLSLSITSNFDMTNYVGIRMFIYPDRVELVNPTGNEPYSTKSFPYTGAFTFTGSTHNENIIFYNGSYAVTLDNYNCTLRNTYAGSCLDLRDGANVTVTLKGTNKLVASWEGSAIRVPSGTTVTIGGDGTLDASYQKGGNGAYGAAIGGESNHDFGTIRITGGTIKASGYNDYCIGAGNNYNSQIEQKTGTIDITGGTVIAKTIGNADQKTGAVVNITGGTVRCNSIYADTTGVETFVYDTEGKNPRVYGNVTLGENYTLPAGEKLTIQNNATLTIPEGVTLNVEGGHLDNNGIIENYGTIVGGTDGTVQKPSALTLTVTDSENTPVTEATYGDRITIIAKIAEKATTRAITNNKMAFYLGDIQLGDLDVQTDGTAQLTLALSGDHWMPGKKTLTVKFTGSNSLTKATAEMELTVKKAPQAAPVPVKDFTVGYQNEKLTFSPSVEVWTAKDGGTKLTSPVSLSEHLGKTLYARFMETDTLLASDWTVIPIAQRPAAPTGITGGRATLNGVKDTMEYSLDGKTFTKVPTDATKAENLKAGIYLVRFAATATAPASSAVQVTVYDSTGSLTTTETNGSVTTETIQRDDGTSTVITTEKKPNGTVESLLENKDKNGKVTSSQTTITQPDGSKVVIQLPDNGSKVVTEYDKNGKVIQQTTYPDKNKPAYIISGYTPKIVEGNGRRFWGWSLALRTDDALCNFQDVLVQGLSLNPSNYEVSEKNGTTQITLKRGYLAKLPAGTYKIGIVSTNGTAWGTFVIPTNAEGWNPGTGDYILIAGATLLLTTAALTLLLLRRKRRQ